MSVEHLPDDDWPGERIEAWRKFLRGSWLEEWVASQVKATGLVAPEHLHVGINPKIQRRPFELDVVAIHGHHLYVMSCTIDHAAPLCKSKLFEVAMRARQLGGDLARSALVCLADKDKDGNDIVGELQADVRTISEAQREPKVFGLGHLREWAGWRGGAPDLKSLVQWLES